MLRKTTVLYVVTESEWGGASRYVFDLATHLDPQEFDVTVAAAGKGDLLAALEKHNIKTVRLHRMVRPISPVHDLLGLWELFVLYRRLQPDIIHLNSSKAGFLGTFAAFLYKLTAKSCKLVYTAHGWVFNEPDRSARWYRRLERMASYLRSAIICVSDYDHEAALMWSIARPEKLVTIHNGIDVAAMRFLERETARRELGIWNQELGTKFIGTIANFYSTKGLEYLIEALSLLSPEIRNTGYGIQSVIIGDGPLRPTLEALIKKHGLGDRTVLVGQMPEAHRYLKAFDVFVLPSLKEGLPLALLEALAAGVPAIASAVGGIPEIVQASDKAIRLVPAADAEALATAITTTLAAASPNTAKHFPQEFMIETMVNETKEVYFNLR